MEDGMYKIKERTDKRKTKESRVCTTRSGIGTKGKGICEKIIHDDSINYCHDDKNKDDHGS
jgi:hypothetical protein